MCFYLIRKNRLFKTTYSFQIFMKLKEDVTLIYFMSITFIRFKTDTAEYTKYQLFPIFPFSKSIC